MFHVEHPAPNGDRFCKILLEGATPLGLALSESVIAQCLRYFQEIQAWNQKTNLTAITDEQDIAVKHFLDSLACSQALNQPGQAKLLDVGSGAGFPGIPLKLLYPGLAVTLLEPSQKKTAFLRHIIGTLDLARTVAIPKRIEEFSCEPAHQAGFTHIITRAVNVEHLLKSFLPVLGQQGVIILCRARPLEKDFPLGILQIRLEIAYTLPMGYGARVLSLLERKASV